MKRLLVVFAVLGLLSSAATAAVHVKPAEPLHISQGETCALTDFLVPGKTVIFDFSSKFCGPCQAYNEPLKLLHARRADIVVVEVDINRPNLEAIDWLSPVAQQYDLHAIPHFKVYSPDGKLIAQDRIVFGADGRPDRTLSTTAGRQMVDGLINGLAK